MSTPATCGNPPVPKASTPELLSSSLELLNHDSTLSVTRIYGNENREDSYHQEKSGFQCSGCRKLTSRIEVLESHAKKVMATLQQILDLQRNGTENSEVIKVQLFINRMFHLTFIYLITNEIYN